MSTSSDVEPETVGVGVLTVVSLLLGLLVLFWPGPIAPTDRLPFALILLVPAVIGGARVRRDLT